MRIWSFGFLVLLAVSATGCVQLTLAWADLNPAGPKAEPDVLGTFEGDGPVTTIEDWERSRAPALREAFQANLYGYFPDASSVDILEHRVLDKAAFDGAGQLEEYKLEATASFNGSDQKTEPFYLDVVLPAAADGPVPVILMETFCPRWDTIPHPDVARPKESGSCNDGPMTGVFAYVFGRYIATPPLETILARGYGVATIFPGEYVPDSKEKGLAALSALDPDATDPDRRWGAVAAWAWGYSLIIDVLENDPAVDTFITYGHSRYGKAALVAAAFDTRVDGVIAHQSGTGGASLNRKKKGESVGAITENYPHWFASVYARYAGHEEDMPVDQHQLLALVAPRPILLGNARRDVWSDPNGAFRAAIGADPVWKLYGGDGLDQKRLKPFNPQADIAFWIRPGTHGVVREDWPAFLDFLDAHFKPAPMLTRR
ncbi:MAG: alpha/beta hydrolase [Parvularculaceae bacterium]